MKNVILALQQDQELKNSALFKWMQVGGGALVFVIGGVLSVARAFGYDVDLSDDQIKAVAYGAVMVFGGTSALFTMITSKKIGIGSLLEPELTRGES